ncbi:hypothetical protein BKA66DRAFT_565282 [Pyrenochaeta sp. MPI-SDFR-AT-0127]|nr:hypothetical protein BKA66DRAFT_565282 [Pyrenochaeta sp. MPI-SDFR-AT-0127]
MCVVFLTDKKLCMHSDSIGFHFCGGSNCGSDTYHIFYLPDSEKYCMKCVALHKTDNEADISPVEYYPPIQLFESEEKDKASPNQNMKASPVVYQRSEADLSDVDSETSYWKLDGTAGDEEALSASNTAVNQEDVDLCKSGETRQKSPSPNAQRHRELVSDQLANLPRYLEQNDIRPFDSSPYAAQCRNYCNDQLPYQHFLDFAYGRYPNPPSWLQTATPLPYCLPPGAAVQNIQASTYLYDGHQIRTTRPSPTCHEYRGR